MKHSLLLLNFCFIVFSTAFKAQDTLKLKDGSELLVKVQEISETSIKYKKFENLKGPSYLIPVNQVIVISYSNGSKEVMTKNTSSAANSNPGAENEFQDYKKKSPKRSQPVKAPYKKSGPRLGCTYIGEGTASDYIKDLAKVPFVSQIGWELEARIFSTEKGIAAMAECYFLMAGMEQGLFMPSGSVLIALRDREGLELAVGPNFSYYDKFILGMEFSVGTTLHFSDVHFPVNISFVPSVTQAETVVTYTGQKSTVTLKSGFRVSLVFGFYSKLR